MKVKSSPAQSGGFKAASRGLKEQAGKSKRARCGCLRGRSAHARLENTSKSPITRHSIVRIRWRLAQSSFHRARVMIEGLGDNDQRS